MPSRRHVMIALTALLAAPSLAEGKGKKKKRKKKPKSSASCPTCRSARRASQPATASTAVRRVLHRFVIQQLLQCRWEVRVCQE